MTTRKFPDTLLILTAILLLFVILTHILPAGEFMRTEINGRAVVVPGSYERVAATPQGIADFFTAPIKGFISAAQIIAFVFLVGGAFSLLNRTGAVDAGLQQVVRASKRNPQHRKAVIPVVMILFSLCGATFGMSEEVLVFVLITIPLATALGYDAIVGTAISFVGAGAGFAGAFLNPFTVGIAQGIADLPPFSGIEFRLFAWFLMTAAAIIYVMRYARKTERDPAESLLHGTMQNYATLAADELPFTVRRKAVLFLLLSTLGVLIYGASRLGWYINEITGLFLALGAGAALIGRLSGEEAAEAFKEGARDMITPALVIAFAKGLIIVAEDGKIIDTVLHALVGLAEGMPRTASAEIMFFLQSGLNFFIPSGSGQAALTMPIMAPLSDLLGLSRQTAVLAYQFGDGLSNMIIPTSGVTMGVLAIAKIRYDLWLRWMFPLFCIMSLLAMLLLAVAVFFEVW